MEAFEAEFAAYCGVNHCIGVGNGLDALHLILRGYGIGQGDEVIVPSNTYMPHGWPFPIPGQRQRLSNPLNRRFLYSKGPQTKIFNDTGWTVQISMGA